MPLPIDVKTFRFSQGLIVGVLLALLYPLAVLATVSPQEAAWNILRHDITWSIYNVVFLPVGIGLLYSVIDLDVFRRFPVFFRWLLAGLYLAGILIIGFATAADSEGIPSAERVAATASGNGRHAQATFIEIDKCLRSPTTCIDENGNSRRDEYLRNVPECRKAWAKRFNSELGIPSTLDEQDHLKRLGASMRRHAYFCEAIKKLELDKFELRMSPVRYVAAVLNFIFVSYVWTFTLVVLCYFLSARVETGDRAVNILTGCWVVLVTWFFFRAYSEWYLWYGDLVHLQWYQAYLVLAGTAVVLFTVLAVWIISIKTGTSPPAAIAAVYSILAAGIGAIGAINPGVLRTGFEMFQGLSPALFCMVILVVLAVVAVYVGVLLQWAEAFVLSVC